MWCPEVDFRIPNLTSGLFVRLKFCHAGSFEETFNFVFWSTLVSCDVIMDWILLSLCVDELVVFSCLMFLGTGSKELVSVWIGLL